MKETRYHSLDACRSTMLLLGLVLHSSLTYCVFTVQLSVLPVDHPSHFGWHFVDGASHPFIDLFYMYIHTFRMPVFFILAGFFSAMMIKKYGSKIYINKRMMRIGLPFLAAWILIIPLERQTAFLVNRIAGGREQYITEHAWRGYFNEIWNNTGAFWFLFYLIIISLLTFIAVKFYANLKDKLNWSFGTRKLPLILIFISVTALSFALLSFSPVPYLPDDQDFIPDWYLVFTYILFYGLGYYWYTHQSQLFGLGKVFWLFLILGTVTFFAYMYCISSLI